MMNPISTTLRRLETRTGIRQLPMTVSGWFQMAAHVPWLKSAALTSTEVIRGQLPNDVLVIATAV